MDGTFALYKILNVIGEDDKNNPTVRTLFSTDNVIPLSGPAETLTNPNDLAECQNTPATAYVRGSFCFEYWVPLTVRVTQACVRPE